MKKLSIEINGLEYVAKTEVATSDEINSLVNQINELEHELGLASYEDERKGLIINELKEQIADFSAECHEYMNEINELQEEIELARVRVFDLEEENEGLVNQINDLTKALEAIQTISERAL